jgi:hypothetical protein
LSFFGFEREKVPMLAISVGGVADAFDLLIG